MKKNRYKKLLAAVTMSAIVLSAVPVYAAAQNLESFEKNASLTLKRESSVSIGDPNADGGVAEIVSYSSQKGYAYVVNGQDAILDVNKVSNGKLTPYKSIDVKSVIAEKAAGFEYGDMTSVAVDDENGRIAVSVQKKDYTKNGIAVLMNYEGEYITHYSTGVQPDMITFAENGRYVLTADEGEPREGYSAGTTDPKGTVTIIDTLAEAEPKRAGFDDFKAEELAAKGVIIGKVNGTMNDPSADLEPEYIASSGGKAYVSLQEANAIAVIDIASASVESVNPLGFKDLSLEENAVDLKDDGKYHPNTYKDAVAAYMPDAISVYTSGGKTYLVTANEGDSREWNGYKNEEKADLTSLDGADTAKKVRILNDDLVGGTPAGKACLFGGRSFSVIDASTMGIVYDSGNDFEELTAKYLPSWFNCSNDDTAMDSRSQKKGPEPESTALGQIGGKTYAFIGIERIGGIMAYDVTNPDAPKFVNYINSRDFSAGLSGDNSPEGLAFIGADDSDLGKPILLAAYEVSGTLASYSIDGVSTENSGSDGNGDSSINDDSENDNGADDNGTDDGGESSDNANDGDETDDQNIQSSSDKENYNDNKEVPETGDVRSVMLWVSLAGACLTMISAALIVKRRIRCREQNK